MTMGVFQLGVLLAEQQRNAEAIEYLRRAIELQPSLAQAHYRLGQLYQRVGRQRSRREGAGGLSRVEGQGRRQVSTGRLPAAGTVVNRRIFVQSVLTGIGAGLAGGVAAQTQRERRSNGWIIPTNKPDRFNLKVMAFNPIPAPDLEASGT